MVTVTVEPSVTEDVAAIVMSLVVGVPVPKTHAPLPLLFLARTRTPIRGAVGKAGDRLRGRRRRHLSTARDRDPCRCSVIAGRCRGIGDRALGRRRIVDVVACHGAHGCGPAKVQLGIARGYHQVRGRSERLVADRDHRGAALLLTI